VVDRVMIVIPAGQPGPLGEAEAAVGALRRGAAAAGHVEDLDVPFLPGVPGQVVDHAPSQPAAAVPGRDHEAADLRPVPAHPMALPDQVAAGDDLAEVVLGDD